MTNTYTWVIDDIFVNPSTAGQTDVVVNINYHVNGTDGTHTASVHNNQNLTYTSGNPFTAYTNLTETEVIGWIQNALGNTAVNEIQTTLDAQILNMAQPTITVKSLPLPWVTI